MDLLARAIEVAETAGLKLQTEGKKWRPKRYMLVHTMWTIRYAANYEEIMAVLNEKHFLFEAQVFDLESDSYMVGQQMAVTGIVLGV